MYRTRMIGLLTAVLSVALVNCGTRPTEETSLSKTQSLAGVTDPGWRMTQQPMTVHRVFHTSTLLSNGQILVAGGHDDYHPQYYSTAELYDPATDSFIPTSPMSLQRQGHSATLLNDGTVLVAGGEIYDDLYIPLADLYDPATGKWTETGAMSFRRGYHIAVKLADGRVLVAGGRSGRGGGDSQTTAEIYDPATNSWSTTGHMNIWRDEGFKAVLLPNGKVLVSGGHADDYGYPINGNPNRIVGSTAELFDPATNSWSITGQMNEGRMHHTMTLLPNGKVLVAGGESVNPNPNTDVPSATAELYDPATGLWTYTGNMSQARRSHTATLLSDGTVVAVGGSSSGALDVSAMLTTVETYDPVSGTWYENSSMLEPRGFHTAVLLPDSGQIIVMGGWGQSRGTPKGTAEVQNACSFMLCNEHANEVCMNNPGTCSKGKCTYTPKAKDTPCGSGSGDACGSSSLCDGNGTCQSGQPMSCPKADPVYYCGGDLEMQVYKHETPGTCSNGQCDPPFEAWVQNCDPTDAAFCVGDAIYIMHYYGGCTNGQCDTGGDSTFYEPCKPGPVGPKHCDDTKTNLMQRIAPGGCTDGACNDPAEQTIENCANGCVDATSTTAAHCASAPSKQFDLGTWSWKLGN